MKQTTQVTLLARRFVRLAASGVMLLMLLSGCGGKKAASEEQAVLAGKADQVRDQVLKSLGESGIARQLPFSGSGFQQEALHDISRVHDYLKQSNKAIPALHLGVYMSDLGYLMDFDKKEEARQYFEGCVLLANDVGLNRQFSQAVELRFGEIISGNEALGKSLDRLYKFADNSSDEFKKMHAAALTGYYVEELYHLAVFVQSSVQDESGSGLRMKAVQTLLGQKKEVGNLVGYFDHLKLRPEGIALYQDFLKLQTKYQALDMDRLLKITDPLVILQDGNVQDVLNLIMMIRKAITEN